MDLGFWAGGREGESEEYEPIVWVIPEVCMGTRATNQVSINLARAGGHSFGE
jgi:hypothetical protein